MEITKYTIGVAFSFDRKEQQRLDNHLKALEAKFAKFSSRFGKSFGISIDNFSVNEKKLNLVLGNALDAASKKVTFEISNFAVNTRNMQAALMRASRIAGGAVSFTSGGVGQGQLSREEWDRRTLTTSRLRREEAVARQAERLEILRERALLSPRRMAGSAGVGGAVGGSFGSLFPSGGVLGAGLALAGGGYGLAALNQRNQQVVAAQLQTQAVVQQAGGTAQQGTQSFDFLRSQANRIGFNYLEAAPDFNKLLSGLTGAGVSVEESQNVFKGFAELARVNKLGRVEQNRLFRALSQVAGKGKLQAEELTGQIAEALPGGTALFARAYQKQIGGNLVGKEAIAALMDAMKKGQVKSDILTFAAQLASQQAQPGLAAASTASQAEQARFQNVTNDMSILASNKGVEEGFARIFRTLNQGLAESGPLVTKLAQGFNEATKWADDLLLFPQSFARALDGRDSLVADWLGTEATKQLRDDWNSIKESMQTISNISSPDWLPTLQQLTFNAANVIKGVAAISNGDFSGLTAAVNSLIANSINMVTTPGRAGVNMALRGVGELGGFTVPQLGPVYGENPGSGYWSPFRPTGIGRPLVFNDPFSQQSIDYPDPFNKAMDTQKQGYNSFGLRKAEMDMKISVSITADDLDDLKFKTTESLRDAVEQFKREEYGITLDQFPER